MNWFMMAGLIPSGLLSCSSTRNDCKIVSLAKLNRLMNITPIRKPWAPPITTGPIQLEARPMYGS